MPDWPEIRLENWSQFIDVTNLATVGRPSLTAYLFRGQAKSSWKLRPTLIRNLSEKVTAAQLLEIEGVAGSQFRSQAHLHVPSTQLPEKIAPLSWWSLMRHYGAPTRILDWTGSPYVAAYFAVVAEPESSGAVWCFHPYTLRRRIRERFGAPDSIGPRLDQVFFQADAPDHLHSFEPPIMNARVIAQQSRATVSPNVFLDHDDLIFSTMEKNEPGITLLTKVIIPPGLKMDFMHELIRMNVTANALFPGIEGLGRSVEELIKVELSVLSV